MESLQPNGSIEKGVIVTLNSNGTMSRKVVTGEPKPKGRRRKKMEPTEEMRAEFQRRFEESEKAEAERIEGTKKRKANRKKLDAQTVVMEDQGHTRTVKRVMTTCERMFYFKTLPAHLLASVKAFARIAADAQAVATLDGDDSTNHLTGSYSPSFGAPGFKPKTLTDRQIAGLTALRRMRARIPDDIRKTFELIVAEETGCRKPGRDETVSKIGERHGFKHKQAASAGAMQVYCIAALIAQFMKEGGEVWVHAKAAETKKNEAQKAA